MNLDFYSILKTKKESPFSIAKSNDDFPFSSKAFRFALLSRRVRTILSDPTKTINFQSNAKESIPIVFFFKPLIDAKCNAVCFLLSVMFTIARPSLISSSTTRLWPKNTIGFFFIARSFIVNIIQTTFGRSQVQRSETINILHINVCFAFDQ